MSARSGLASPLRLPGPPLRGEAALASETQRRLDTWLEPAPLRQREIPVVWAARVAPIAEPWVLAVIATPAEIERDV